MKRIAIILITSSIILTGCNNNNKEEIEEIKPFCDYVDINNTKYNILYIGIDNPFQITPYGNFDSISVRIPDSIGTINKYDKNRYFIRVKRPGKVNLKVFAINKKKEHLVTSKYFRVMSLPNPVVKLGMKKGGEIKKETIIAIGKIVALEESLAMIEYKHKMVSYSISTVSQKGEIIENKSDSEYFTEKQIEQISTLKSGDKIYFEDIVIEDLSGKERKLNPMMFRIKN